MLKPTVVMYWPRVLTPAEIRKVYEEQCLEAFRDQSGFGNHGKVNKVSGSTECR